MYFVWKQWKTIHSLFSIDFCFTECVNSFENVASVFHNACLQLKKAVVNNSFNVVQVIQSVRTSRKLIFLLLKSSSLTTTSFFSLYPYNNCLFMPFYHFVLNEMTQLCERVCLVLPSAVGACLYRNAGLLFSLSPFPRAGVFLRLIGYFQGYYLQADSLIS